MNKEINVQMVSDLIKLSKKPTLVYMSKGKYSKPDRRIEGVSLVPGELRLCTPIEMEVWKTCKLKPVTARELLSIVSRKLNISYPDVYGAMSSLEAANALCHVTARSQIEAALLCAEKMKLEAVVKIPNKHVFIKNCFEKNGIKGMWEAIKLTSLNKYTLSFEERRLYNAIKKGQTFSEYFAKSMWLGSRIPNYGRLNIIAYNKYNSIGKAFMSLIDKLLIVAY